MHRSPLINHPATKYRTRRPALKMIMALVLVALMVITGWVGWRLWERFSPPKDFTQVRTIAGAGPKINAQSAQTISDPFGVAADEDGTCYVTDGEGGKLYRIDTKGNTSLVTDQLDMASAVAVAPDGSIIVANTGAHTIVKVDAKNGGVRVLAGNAGESGDKDGAATEARFNAPIGVAVASDGAIFVADTYNDRIRRIALDGKVSTLAGGSEQGFADGRGAEARFDTPCGVAVAMDGSLLVADTGNHRIRRVALDGTVSTVAGIGEGEGNDSQPMTAAFYEPMAIAVTGPDEFYVADAGSSSVRFCKLSNTPAKRAPALKAFDASGVYTVAGGFPSGLNDGALANVRLNRPTGIALTGKNLLVFADSGNGLVRAFVQQDSKLGTLSKSDLARIAASDIRAAVPPRWPFNPPDAKREIAGTLGEVRGERAEGRDAWYHNGLDIPGAYGETVRAIYAERVRLPLAVEGVGGPRERIRLPLIGYIHLRIGRDQNDQPFGMNGVSFRRDEKGRVIGVRIRRGTRINAGNAIGTLNSLNHVHLIAGPSGNEVNAIMAIELPGLVDTVSPIIESVRIVNADGSAIEPQKPSQSFSVSGKVQVILRAYDQADGNAGYRKLGLFRAGYQLLKADGTPVQGFEEPHFNIVFDRLPADPRTVMLVYAEGSQSGYTGKTIFDYVVTNVVRDGSAQENWLDVSPLQRGDYIVRVLAEDYFRNRATRDIKILVGEK